MKYILVNKNKLIPSVINFTSEKSAIRELIEITNNYNNPNLLKNIYIYASDENEETEYIIFNENNNIVKKKLFNNDYLTFFSMNSLQYNNSLIINTKNIIINENDEKKKNTNNENILINEKDKIKKSCEEVFELYQNELSKIKKIENNLKNLEKKEDKIKNKIINNNIDIVNKLYLDYKTFLKIKEKFKDNSDKFTIPELFIKKYVYFNELLLNKDYYIILDKLKTININDPANYLSNNDIILFSKKYLLDSKNLNYSFDHNWDDLTSDTEGIIKPKGWSNRINN
jgi:hypothetical protein